jgi:hypothetical protein
VQPRSYRNELEGMLSTPHLMPPCSVLGDVVLASYHVAAWHHVVLLVKGIDFDAEK